MHISVPFAKGKTSLPLDRTRRPGAATNFSPLREGENFVAQVFFGEHQA